MAVAALLTGAFVPVAIAQTPAGTPVTNVAGAQFSAGGAPGSTPSNAVVTNVLPFYRIGLSPPGTPASPAFVLAGVAGDTLYGAFAIDNLGNARDSVVVGSTLVPPSGISVGPIVFFGDADGNGRFDPGEDDPGFLAVARGGSIAMNVAVVIPPGTAAGDAFVEVAASSANDPPGTRVTSVFQVSCSGQAPVSVHFGPRGNPTAAPGGEGSADDVTVGTLGYGDYQYTFENDILNASTAAAAFEVFLADSTGLPPDVTVSFADSAGVALAPSSPPNSALVGSIGGGGTARVRVTARSSLRPLYQNVGSGYDFRLEARALTDTTASNRTVDRLMPPTPVSGAALVLRQAFREGRVSAGDVATLVVTITNITDSLRVDNVVVGQAPHPVLDFSSSPQFSHTGGQLQWYVGSLDPGESRTTVVKFVANSRVRHGNADVTGNAAGVAATGESVSAAPVRSLLRVDNDLFASEGIILGDVFIDENRNGVRDDGEEGIPGATVYLESGDYAIADSAGVFSLPRVFAGWRVVRLDESTIPPGVVFPDPLSGPWDGRRGNERLERLVPGGHVRVKFPLERVPPPTIEVPHSVGLQEKVSVSKEARLYGALSLPSSHFAVGRARLLAGASNDLGPVVAFLLDHPGWKVFLEGHTDSIPINTPEFPSNQELSLARANAVADYLVAVGISRDRCLVRGWGESRPLVSNESLEGRRLNRRVEISFVPPGVAVTGDGRVPVEHTAIRDLSVLPDTFHVSVFWEITSSSDVPADGTLRLHVPRQFIDQRFDVRFEDRPVLPDSAGVYGFSGLRRSQPLACTLGFRATEADTAAVGQIRAVVEFKGHPDLAVGPVTIRPLHNRASRHGTAQTELIGWTEAELLSDYEKRMNGVDVSDSTGVEALVVVSVGDVSRPAIVEPADGAVYNRRDQISISARVPVGGLSSVAVDGVVVGEERVGRRVIDPEKGMEVVTWYGVRIRSGWNTIVLRAESIDGSVARDTVRVALSARPRFLEPMRARYVIEADGRARVPVRFAVRDGWGLPVADGIVATVVEGADMVDPVDARPSEPGMQVVSRNGAIDLVTLPQRDRGSQDIVVEIEGMRATSELVFVSPDKPVMATGVVDVLVGGYNKSGDGSGDGVDNFTDGGVFQSEARLFVQGATIKGINLTARLDTKKRFDDPLLKNMDPDRQYPMYGDGSTLRYAAPSQGGNYVSLEKGESYLRYGDFRTPLVETELLAYQRATTGVNGSLVHEGDRLRFFAAQTDFVTHIDEIRADGTSGFYYLSNKPIVEYSEKIMVETRDRWQPERVLSIQPMVRYQDYTINPWDGTVLFKYPIRAYDEYFNPLTIVVIYEVENRNNDSWLYGARGTVVRGDNYRVGVTGVADDRAAENYYLYGVDGSFKAAGFTVGGEVGRSEDPLAGAGNAYKILAAYDNAAGFVSGYYRRIDGTFNNPSFRGGDSELASLKSGFKAQLGKGDGLGLDAAGWAHQLYRSNERRENVRGVVTYRRRLYEFMGGLRAARHDGPEGDRQGLLSVVGTRIGDDHRTGLSARWEHNLRDQWVPDFPNRFIATGAYGINHNARLLASYEYLTASGRPSTHQLTSGVEGNLSPSARAYTKYQMNEMASERRMGAISGIQQRMRVSPHTTGLLGLEGLASLSGREQEEYLAFTSGLDWRVPGSHFAEGQCEIRWMRSRVRYGLRLNAAKQLSRGTGWVLRNVFGFANVSEGEDELTYHGQLAGAWRVPDRPVQTLAQVRTDYERYTPVDPEAITWRTVFSVDLNWSPVVAHETRLKYACKHVEDYSYGISTTTDADLVLGQYIYRFLYNWDLDVWGRWLHHRHGGGAEVGGGIELGHLFFRALRVAGGYSINGFEDPDFVGTDAWSQGFGVRVQLILTEWLLPEFARINGE